MATVKVELTEAESGWLLCAAKSFMPDMQDLRSINCLDRAIEKLHAARDKPKSRRKK